MKISKINPTIDGESPARAVNGMNGKIKSVLSGTGSSLPARIVRNQEFVATLDTTDEWIRTPHGHSRTSLCWSGRDLGHPWHHRSEECSGQGPARVQ